MSSIPRKFHKQDASVFLNRLRSEMASEGLQLPRDMSKVGHAPGMTLLDTVAAI